MRRFRSLLFLAPVVCALAHPSSLRAQAAFPDPTTRWQVAPAEGQLPGWQFVANALSLPPEFLPMPATTNSSQPRLSPPPSR